MQQVVEQNQCITTHKLDFGSCPWINPLTKQPSEDWMLYKIGTVTGQWGCTPDAYIILSFLNHNPGNGHLDDVFEWFEHSCRRDKRNLIIMDIMNSRFLMHLLAKRGFTQLDSECNHVIKIFDTKAYKRFRRKGNKFLYPDGSTKN